MQRNNNSNYSNTWYRNHQILSTETSENTFGSQGSDEIWFQVSIQFIAKISTAKQPKFYCNWWLTGTLHKAITLQNTRYSITCDLEINQNIHLGKLNENTIQAIQNLSVLAAWVL